MSLNKELKRLYAKIMESLPAEVSKRISLENQKLFSSFLYDKVLKAGDNSPDVSFYDKDLKVVSLTKLLEEHHIVLSFSRGSWCPYCNLELQTLAKFNEQIKKRNAILIAVSPELYQFAEENLKNKKINFPVLTDLGNNSADKFGLVFELPETYREMYQDFNLHLNVLNGDDSWTLPVPATFVISKEGKIMSTYINVDYTQRMEPEDILAQLELLSEK